MHATRSASIEPLAVNGRTGFTVAGISTRLVFIVMSNKMPGIPSKNPLRAIPSRHPSDMTEQWVTGDIVRYNSVRFGWGQVVNMGNLLQTKLDVDAKRSS